MKSVALRTLSIAVPALLAFASLVLGGCIDGNSCDIIPDGAFGKGWPAFTQVWNVKAVAADDVTILSKTPDMVVQKHGAKSQIDKPLLKLSAPPGGESSVETKKIAIPKAGAILLNFNAMAYEGNTKGSIRYETVAGKLIWEVQFSNFNSGSWMNHNFNYSPLSGENFIVIKVLIDGKTAVSSPSVYFSSIRACLADSSIAKRELLTSDVRHKGWATCGGARYSSNNDGAGVTIPNSAIVGYMRFPSGSSDSSISRKFQSVVGVSYQIKAFTGNPENDGSLRVYINDIEQEVSWSKDNLSNGVLSLVHTSVRQETLLTFARLNGLSATKNDAVIHQLNITAMNCFAPAFLG